MSTIKTLLDEATAALKDFSQTARLDSEILLCHVLEIPRSSLIAHSEREVPKPNKQEFIQLVLRRRKYEPVAYLIGKKEFFGIEFSVNPSVLIPRPETELLVEIAVKRAISFNKKLRILDLGTGSGCVAVAIGAELLKREMAFEIDAVDFDEGAVKTASENVIANGLGSSINVIKSDWFAELKEERKYHIIAGNPPYIAEGDKDVSPETRFEPQHALYSGHSGLESLRKLIVSSLKFAKPKACIMFEMGHAQGEILKNFCENMLADSCYRYLIKIHNDLAGHNRVIELQMIKEEK